MVGRREQQVDVGGAVDAAAAPARRSAGNATQIARRLRELGIRPTGPRVGILSFMTEHDQPYSARTVFQHFLDRRFALKLPTIYRVLCDLERQGLLSREWGAAGEAIYSLRHALESVPQFRVVCRSCNHTLAFEDLQIAQQLQDALLAQACVSEAGSLSVHVTCARCSARFERQDLGARLRRRETLSLST